MIGEIYMYIKEYLIKKLKEIFICGNHQITAVIKANGKAVVEI
jgi:hypothetical protein